MSKKVAVLFSGGLDSTYLVWKNLKDGNEVTPIYIEIENNKTKTILEKNRIELLWKRFSIEFNDENDYLKRPLNGIQYAVSVGVKANENSLYFTQMPIWIFALTFCQSMDVDEIQIGYVMNDDAISYLEDIQNMYKAYQPICEPMKPLTFPSSKRKKYQMAKELPRQYLELIFSCEMATIIGPEDAEIIQYEPCCECVPCSHIIESDYYGTGHFPENYNKNLIKYHARKLIDRGCKVLNEEGKEFHYYGWDEDLAVKAPDEPRQLAIEFPGSVTLERDDEIEADDSNLKPEQIVKKLTNFFTKG